MKRFSLLIIATLLLTPLFSEVYKTGVTASYYAEDFHGKRTSNGERFNMNDYTCAHKSLPFNTVLKVTNLANGKTCEVRVNDRGPFVASREIDLSKAAAIKLGMIGSGTTKVKLEIIKKGANTKISQQTAACASKIMAKLSGGFPSNSKTSANSKKPANIAPGTYWDIQLGAFSSKENAKEFARKVSHAGFKNIVLQTSASKGITRVAIKKVPASKVTDTQNKLTAAGFTEQTLRQRKD
ncbi:rare lipoprotein A [Treponema bryantii]|uniref:Probable endolytic peptidoglycan transglycosylase RlpA n=1 Tax=Treponema bryantii TaxID=163 RepID=A0A1H9E6Z4_9SPIR|nr:septal ring lytic transglycosylase RlpA family protein [Treponema bryantii]SEQ21461.1 rare lipoprotein A [Treponema bryantii]